MLSLASAHAVDQFDQLGVEDAVSAAGFAYFSMVQMHSTDFTDAGISRINPDDAQVQYGHERHGRFDEAKHVYLQLTAVIQGNEASM